MACKKPGCCKETIQQEAVQKPAKPEPHDIAEVLATISEILDGSGMQLSSIEITIPTSIHDPSRTTSIKKLAKMQADVLVRHNYAGRATQIIMNWQGCQHYGHRVHTAANPLADK